MNQYRCHICSYWTWADTLPIDFLDERTHKACAQNKLRWEAYHDYPSTQNKEGKTMDIFHLLFSYHGRISKGIWWISQIAVLLLAALTGWIYHKFGFHDALLGAIGTLVVFVIRIFLNIKRLHDQGLSGKWILALELPGLGWPLAAVLWIIPVWGLYASCLCMLTAFIGFIATIYILGCRDGHDGENQHGEPVHSVSLSSTKTIVPLLLLCLFVAGCAGAVHLATSETTITAIELAFMIFEKTKELHDAGVDQKILDEVHDAIKQTHDIIDKHHAEHVEDK